MKHQVAAGTFVRSVAAAVEVVAGGVAIEVGAVQEHLRRKLATRHFSGILLLAAHQNVAESMPYSAPDFSSSRRIRQSAMSCTKCYVDFLPAAAFPHGAPAAAQATFRPTSEAM
jgi:hypothetical protein